MQGADESREEIPRIRPGPGAMAGASMIALLLAVGFSGLSAAHARPTTAAPYHGTETNINQVFATSCAHSKIVQGAHFKLYSGIGGFSDSARESYCSSASIPPDTDVYASAASQFETAMKFSVSTTGPHTVTATYSLKSSWSEGMTLGICPPASTPSFCTEETFAELDACGQVYDATNGTILNASTCSLAQFNFTLNETICANTTTCFYVNGGAPATGTVTGSYTVVVTGAMVSTHVYYVELWVQGYAYTLSETGNTTFIGTSSGYATENVNTNSPPGDYAKLTSVVVS